MYPKYSMENCIYPPLKKIFTLFFLFISIYGFGQKNFRKEAFPNHYKSLKQALRNPLHARKVEIRYADSIFPNDAVLKLRNVENIAWYASGPSIGEIKNAKRKKLNIRDSIFPFPKIRIDTTALKQLSHLKYLSFIGFSNGFPKGICVLKNLKTLSIVLGDIDSIPPEIGNLKNLVLLDFPWNNINFLPQEIIQLDSLKYLGLGHNSFTNIPLQLLSLKKLEDVNLGNGGQSDEDPLGIEWPYKVHINKINYIREIELFESLLNLKNIKHVFIASPIEEKNKLFLRITDKKLCEKIKWSP